MPHPRKFTDEQVIDAYERNGSVWKAASELGVCGQSVHERLVKLGVDTSRNLFTSDDERYLAERYVLYRDAGKLQVLADEMGRTKPFICRKAGVMGLTDPHRPAPWAHKWFEMPEVVMRPIWDQFKKSKLNVSEFCAERHYNVQSFHDAMNRHFHDEYDDVVESKGDCSTMRARGMKFEFDVRNDLCSHGYHAIRSPASKSPADIYAFRYGEMLFVQCKVGGVFRVDEWNDFYDYSNSVGALAIMASAGIFEHEVSYHRIIGMKDGSNQSPQPMVEWVPTDADDTRDLTCGNGERKFE